MKDGRVAQALSVQLGDLDDFSTWPGSS